MKRKLLQRGICYLAARGFMNFVPDKRYLKMMYWGRTGLKLNLKNPVTFNEKIQWLKLYYREPYYTLIVDKYEVKKYVADLIGENYIIPTIGVYEKFEDIDFSLLPSQFVIKCTHDSGGVVICKDKTQFEIELARKKIVQSLATNYFYHGREWPYKNVKPRIIIEKYMSDDLKNELMDYKLMCFNGSVKCTFTCTNRHAEGGLRVTFYDTEWNKMPFERHYPSEKEPAEKPKSYSKMVSLAEKLSKELPFVRVDFYEINGEIYFGELTLFPGNGYEEFTPNEWDRILGDWIQLPK